MPKLEPSTLIQRFGSKIAAACSDNPIIDVACGSGRNAFFLWSLGCTVICMDRDLSGFRTQLATATGELPSTATKNLIPHQIDLQKDRWPFEPQTVGGIINVHFTLPSLFPHFRSSLVPNGYLLLENTGKSNAERAMVEINLSFVSSEALLKTCYWFSRDFVCEIRNRSDLIADVVLTPRSETPNFDPQPIRDAFTTSALDFALREKIEAKTSGIRDLLLAKAFSESGVLEDEPKGVFGDKIEEMNPVGMFKILSNHQG